MPHICCLCPPTFLQSPPASARPAAASAAAAIAARASSSTAAAEHNAAVMLESLKASVGLGLPPAFASSSTLAQRVSNLEGVLRQIPGTSARPPLAHEALSSRIASLEATLQVRWRG